MGGFDAERFTLRFPFSWKRQRRLFNASVALQRRLNWRRRIPEGLAPHMGSQWWCLTRETLAAILSHPRRAAFERYFAGVWIPDESYFQSLARLVSTRIESRSLTLSKFDFQGKPHVFYDDHLPLLACSDCFVARKIWPGADRLYDELLSDAPSRSRRAAPEPGRIDRLFAAAAERRVRGRDGLYMAGRFPRAHRPAGLTAARYVVVEGVGDLVEGFPDWLSRVTELRVHGHLYAPEGAEFADGATTFAGALSAEARLRDYNPVAFLTNLIWNTRGETQAFLFGPRDSQEPARVVVGDPNADILVITGAWAVPLYRSGRPFAELRREAARLQKIESAHLADLRADWARARIEIRSTAEFVEAPAGTLRWLIAGQGEQRGGEPVEMPRLVDLTGFAAFLQALRDDGMHPYLVGDLGAFAAPAAAETTAVSRPYAVR